LLATCLLSLSPAGSLGRGDGSGELSESIDTDDFRFFG